MKRINYKSDFNFILRLLDCRGDEVGFPDYDWVARFWTGVKANAYEVSCIGGVCKNCYNDDGTIHVVVDNHYLSPGVLRVEFVAMLPDGIYPDGDERVAVPAPLDVELVRAAAPCPSSFEVEVILPYIKFRYEDLTDEQKAELMQPAVDAANHAEAVLKDAEAATAEAVRSNRELAANVEATAEAETQRQHAEETRVSNEESRQRAETLREDAETKRKAAEAARVDTEAVRVASENARITAEADRAKAETARVTAENARVSAESKRVEQEDSRKEAEESRASEETKRVDAEGKRVTAENARKTAEQGRVTAENDRVSAEEARVEAERERATEFESWQSEIDGKADRTELTEGLATKQGNLSTTTDLQLTDDNILGLTDMAKKRLFIDLWNSACGKWGQYNPQTGYFELNGLTDITYEQAVEIYTLTTTTSSYASCRYVNMRNIRTNLPRFSSAYSNRGANEEFLTNCPNIEVLNVATINGEEGDYAKIYAPSSFISNCAKLKRIIGGVNIYICTYNKSATILSRLPQLEEVQLYNFSAIGATLNLGTCPKLNLYTFQYVIRGAYGYDEINGSTIIVHPDVYAKLTGDTTNAAAAELTQEELAQWAQVLVDASEKNIIFATT